MRYLPAFLLMMILACSSACSGSDSDSPGTGVNAPAPVEACNLPAPLGIPHRSAAAGVDEVLDGSAFEPGMAGHLTIDGTAGLFDPDWPVTGSGARDLAYGLYRFDVTPPDGFIRLESDWQAPPPEYWLGLSDYSRNCWEWHDGSTALDLPADLSPYLNSGQLLVAVVATGTGEYPLDSLALVAEPGSGHNLANLFFLHHSTGSGIVRTGDVRSHVALYNGAHTTSFEFWDHGYEHDGLFDPDGVSTGTDYGPLTNQTDPQDLHDLWASDDVGWTALRTTILENHEVIAFKSCYPASNIGDADDLQYRKDLYLSMRDFFDTRPDKLFVVMSPPPLNPASTNEDNAGRARLFADWLNSDTYVAGHPNVVCFDLFDVLAQPDDGSDEANMLRADYRTGDDSHPNRDGYEAAAPALAQAMCAAAEAY